MNTLVAFVVILKISFYLLQLVRFNSPCQLDQSARTHTHTHHTWRMCATLRYMTTDWVRAAACSCHVKRKQFAAKLLHGSACRFPVIRLRFTFAWAKLLLSLSVSLFFPPSLLQPGETRSLCTRRHVSTCVKQNMFDCCSSLRVYVCVCVFRLGACVWV